MNCANSKVIRAVHSLMSRLMSTFPTEPTQSLVASKHEELEQLYARVRKIIEEGEKIRQSSQRGGLVMNTQKSDGFLKS